MSGVTLNNVGKNFGTTEIISNVEMDIQQGEFAVFVGPSGCGKSTLLRMIAGLEDTTRGKISIGGRDVTAVEPAKRGVAMVFQSYALYPHLSVFENMAFSLRLARAKKVEVEEKVRRAADILQLGPQLEKKPSQLSGGQRQRVAIGRAIVREPAVFLFDEPLSNLDAELRVQMRLELTRLHRKIGATMIYVTHDQVEAMTLADRIFVLKSGVVQQSGAPLELYEDPDNLFVGGFIGSPAMNFLEGRVIAREGQRLTLEIADCDGATLQADLKGQLPAEETRLSLGLRPEHLRPAEAGLRVRVEMTEDLGGVSYVHARLPDERNIVFEQRDHRMAHDGQELALSCAPEKVLLFAQDGKRLR